MAYPAVISLKQTINSLLKSSRFPLHSEILESAHNHATSLQQLLNHSGRRRSERFAALDGEIRDCANQLEDVLEFHELYSQHEEDEEVSKAIASFADTVKKVKVEYVEELSKPVDPQDDDDDATVSSYIDFGVEMVGNSEELEKILDALVQRIRPHELWFYSILGEVGSGRTTIAKDIFEEVGKEFDCCAWVTIGMECRLKDVLEQIIDQVNSNQEHHNFVEEEELFNYLCRVLEHRRYMIVLDDVHDVEMVKYLRSSLPNSCNGSVVFLTTTLREIVFATDACLSLQKPAQYFQEECLEMLSSVMFGFDSVPPEMENAGRMIIDNCRGRPISFAKTVLFLYKKERTIEEWSKLAADKENPVFIVEDEISERCSIIKEMQSYNWNLDDEIEDWLVQLIVQLIEDCIYENTVIGQVKTYLNPERFFSKTQILSLLGMAGIGKTTLAKRILRDIKAHECFEHEAWVTLGQKYQPDEVLIDILAQIYPDIDRMQMKADAGLTQNLCVRLSKKKCLIVLDDLWSNEPLCYLKKVFPNIMGTILVTTRLEEAAKFGEDDICLKMRLLDKEESWRLLRQKVLGEGFCPTELEIAGRQIAENCDGLPLLILTVADQLLKFDKTPEFWNNVASGKDKSIFKIAHDQISKSLLPSYEILPENLKTCLLYIGAFRNRFEIPTSSLTNLWIAEGFLEPNLSQTRENFAAECLSKLVARSLVITRHSIVTDSEIKTCRLHSVYWHLANNEAVRNNFFYTMNFYADCSNGSVVSHRRLCIRNNILLGMKDVNDLMECFKTTHSFLCVGSPLQYQVPIIFNMRLLRVMDALTIRLYEFPVEVVKLLHLRYLGITCHGNLPPSISCLQKLQYFIVKRYMSIKSSDKFKLLPVEIWDMRELIHLQIVGGSLPNPDCGDGGLPNLLTLLDVSAESCRKKVLKRIPNLKRLGIRIELLPDEKCNPFRSLNRISRLRKLESLKCEVVNPQVSSEVFAPPAPLTMFPSSLKKLSLSGFGYPWEHMSIINGLKYLEVLKLKHYAFRGPKWIMDYSYYFENLKFILVDCTDLVHWEIKRIKFAKLNRLSIKNCYKLQEIPFHLTHENLTKIEIVDCNPSVVNWAEKMKSIYVNCDLDVNLSWLVPEKRSAASSKSI